VSFLHSQPPTAPTGRREAPYRSGTLQWLAQHLTAGRAPKPRFDIWVGFPVGAPLYAEATGLDWAAAIALAVRFRSERPGARVLVLDAAGVVVG
jgi:hypothetical protein